MNNLVETVINKILSVKPLWLVFLYIILDVICTGMGMGVPFFCILLGFPMGWMIGKYLSDRSSQVPQVLRSILKTAAIMAGITLAGMAIIWLPFSSYLFDPSKDLANTGIPLILFTPKASLIGWIVLMVLISPILQLLTTLFGSFIALISWNPGTVNDQKAV